MLEIIKNQIKAVIDCKDVCTMFEYIGIVCLYTFIFCLFFGLLLASYQIAGAAVLVYSGAVFFCLFWWMLALSDNKSITNKENNQTNNKYN